MRKLLVGVAFIALVAAGCKVVVTPSAPNGWSFLNEGGNGSVHYVNGPGTPPAGRGSALLTVDSTGREAIQTTKYAGLGLSGLSQLQYSTYQAFSGSPNETLTLAFDVDYDSTDNSTAFQGRLVYVPSAAGTVAPNTWQQWNTMSGAAGWYSSATGASAFRPIVGGATQANPPCTQATFCTWASVLSNYPNARIRPSTGALLVRAGGPVTGGFVGATDNVVIGIGGLVVENNFEPGDGSRRREQRQRDEPRLRLRPGDGHRQWRVRQRTEWFGRIRERAAHRQLHGRRAVRDRRVLRHVARQLPVPVVQDVPEEPGNERGDAPARRGLRQHRRHHGVPGPHRLRAEPVGPALDHE